MVIHWCSEFKINDVLFDNRQREFVETVGLILSKNIDYFSLKILKAYLTGYFEHESKLMMDNKYPGSVKHMRSHSELLRKIIDVPLDNSLYPELISSISTSLHDHLMNEDKLMYGYLIKLDKGRV